MNALDLKSGLPYSLVRHGLPFQYARLTQPISTNVVIIGGGISGALTAYQLTRAGIDCVVVDGRTIGLGSTCASTSLLQYEIDVPLHHLIKHRGHHHAVRAYKLCLQAIDKLSTIARRIGLPEFENKDSLYFAARKGDTSMLRDEFEARLANGFNVEYLGENDIRKTYGFAAPGAILSHHGAFTDAYMFTHHLHQYSLKRGLRVYDRTIIQGIRRNSRGVTLKTADGVPIQARKLVYATGYEVTAFLKKKVVNLRSTYATISENMQDVTIPWTTDTLLWNTADPYLYMRRTGDGRLLIGGRDENFYNPTRRDRLIRTKSIALQRDFNRLFPNVDFRPEFSWTGTFGTTADGLPFIGAYKPLPHSYFALGFGGNGIVFSLIAAELIRDALIGKANPDAAIFSFDRT